MKPEDVLSHAPCFLDQDQRKFFFEQGYQVFPELIDKQQLDRLRSALVKIVDASRAINQSNNRIDLEYGHSAQIHGYAGQLTSTISTRFSGKSAPILLLPTSQQIYSARIFGFAT